VAGLVPPEIFPLAYRWHLPPAPTLPGEFTGPFLCLDLPSYKDACWIGLEPLDRTLKGPVFKRRYILRSSGLGFSPFM
jgi:hypothetical protein